MAQPALSGERQPIHDAGIAVDDLLRPINADGAAVCDNVYAVGRLLGGYSPVQQGCGEGVDIASGVHAALQAVMNAGEPMEVTYG
jgi:glycerol-3-phosphate dehydrogenase subunit B